MTCWRCWQSTGSSSAQLLLGWYGFRCHQVLGLVMSYAGSAPHAWGTLTALHLLLWGFWKSWWVSVLPLLPSLWLTSYSPVCPGRGTYSVQASRSCAALIMLGKRGAWVRKIREVIPSTHCTHQSVPFWLLNLQVPLSVCKRPQHVSASYCPSFSCCSDGPESIYKAPHFICFL